MQINKKAEQQERQDMQTEQQERQDMQSTDERFCLEFGAGKGIQSFGDFGKEDTAIGWFAEGWRRWHAM